MTDYEPECPECGEDMVVRRNGKTGEEFYGCSMYPHCDGTVSKESIKPDYPDWASDSDQ